jgi:alpha-beta hydrolase superfamily lysophospholipase
MNYILRILLLISFVPFSPPLQSETARFQSVSFATADGGTIEANLFGKGKQAVVLAHGAIFNKESWNNLARTLADNGLTVLAIDFRGYGKSTSGKDQHALHQDILAAVRFLHKQKTIENVSVLGASMGGGAAAQAAIRATPGEIDELILLSPAPVKHPEKLQGNILYIASKNEALFAQIKAQYEKAPKPKQFLLLEGSAHAQHIFKTDQSEALTQNILIFLKQGHL